MMLKFYTTILGEDYSLVSQDTPDSKKKIQLLASILFVPVIMWFFQGYFLSSMILETSNSVALSTGLVVAFLIFLLERAILLSPKNNRMNVFRISLGLLTAIIGSIIMDEILFHEDINNQMIKYRKGLLQEQLDEIDNRYESQINDLQADAQEKYNVWNSAMEEVKAEADGTGGSGIRGVSQITLTKMQLTNHQQEAYKSAKESFKQLEEKAGQEKAELIDVFNAGFSEKSLLTRLKVMFNFIMEDPVMLVVYIVFTLFLFVMEFLVVIVKSSAPESNYEKKVKMIEAVGSHRMDKMFSMELDTFNPALSSEHSKSAHTLIEHGKNGYLKLGTQN